MLGKPKRLMHSHALEQNIFIRNHAMNWGIPCPSHIPSYLQGRWRMFSLCKTVSNLERQAKQDCCTVAHHSWWSRSFPELHHGVFLCFFPATGIAGLSNVPFISIYHLLHLWQHDLHSPFSVAALHRASSKSGSTGICSSVSGTSCHWSNPSGKVTSLLLLSWLRVRLRLLLLLSLLLLLGTSPCSIENNTHFGVWTWFLLLQILDMALLDWISKGYKAHHAKYWSCNPSISSIIMISSDSLGKIR